MQNWRKALAAFVFCAFVTAPALAQSQGAGAAGGGGEGANIMAGKVQFYTCVGCHGIPDYSNAYPTYHVPRIAGQHAAYIESALQAYRSGDRPHSTMQAQASSLSDEAIRNIAAYLSQLEQ